MKTAKFLQDLKGYQGEAKVFELDPPLDNSKHVIVSAIHCAFDTLRDETLIFPAQQNVDTKEWGVADWGELGGERDLYSHEQVLIDLGYSITF